MTNSKKLALINFTKIRELKYRKRQIGLNMFGVFNNMQSGLLTTNCCFLDALVSKDGVIELEYIKNFINNKTSNYFDVGIRFYSFKPIVSSVDPFFKNNPFKLKDIIIKIDNKKVSNSADLMQKILFSNKEHTFMIKRDKNIFNFSLKPQRRYGGGYISDTFLERFGIFFSKDLKVIENRYNKFGLVVGDVLLKVNNKNVKDYKDIQMALSYTKKSVSLLFLRDGFEFFVTISKRT
jgi:hypothetical protein